MSEAKFIEHKGRRILLEDFSNTKDKADVLATCNRIRELVVKEPENSIYSLVDITNSPFDTEIAQWLKELAKFNKPYVKIVATVGVTGVRMVIFRAILAFSGRKNFELIATRDEALEFLAAQK